MFIGGMSRMSSLDMQAMERHIAQQDRNITPSRSPRPKAKPRALNATELEALRRELLKFINS